MTEIVLIRKETLEYLIKTLDSCQVWLDKDARYAHSNGNVSKAKHNVDTSRRLLNEDVDSFKANAVILRKLIAEQNEMANDSHSQDSN